jgi:hypothetical protein
VRRVVAHLDVEHGREAAEPLGADPERVDLLVELDAQLLGARRGAAPRSSAMSIGSMSDSLAISIAFSAVPPMPMPSMPGGHHPAPIVGTVLSTQSTIESEGFSMANFDLFSEPPPFAATSTSTRSPGTSETCTTAGVLSRVLRRAPAGSASTDARSLFSGSR